jgi:hypothetical protein
MQVSMKASANRPATLEDEERDYEQFPDEVETPMSEMARIRFRKYAKESVFASELGYGLETSINPVIILFSCNFLH